jgi:hypothetical protein|tara:strand:- start:122 stop:310 length:189 start_codon:yes stop_codon:yes gene_type:complete
MGNKMEIDQDIDWLYAQVVKGGLKRPTEKQEDEFDYLVSRYRRLLGLTVSSARTRAFKEVMM